jgi:ferredoxin
MDNIIFYFSGTGNSYKTARTVAKELGSTEIVSMGRNYRSEKQYDIIGFIYPVYFFGLPKRVIEFVSSLNLENNQKAYYFAIATYGGTVGNALYQMYELMQNRHGIKINLTEKLRMFSNYVALYDMRKDVKRITEKSDKKLLPIIDSIKAKKGNSVNKLTKMFSSINSNFIRSAANTDRDYSVNDKCTGCGICKEVCPVGNIEIIDSKPGYKHNCEVCMACIQFCPERAINYKNVTQDRGRYTNPDVNYKELAEKNRAETKHLSGFF